MSSRYFSRNTKSWCKFNKDFTQAELLKASRNSNTPEIVKQFNLANEEFNLELPRRKVQLAKQILGYLIKEEKMSMREFNEFALKHKLTTPGALLADTLTTKTK